MVIRHLTTRQKMAATRKYISNRLHRRPMLASIEMTKFCNAGCDFCDDWKTKHSPKLGDVAAMVRRLNPMVLAITGGEPLLVRNIADSVRRVKQEHKFINVYLITNGSLLTEEKAEELFAAGLDQLSISLNDLDARQDQERKLPGLYEHIAQTIPTLTARGHVVIANAVILRENLDQILPLARQTLEWGAKISYSCYTDFKNGNRKHDFTNLQLERLQQIVAELIRHKRKYGNITNSRYYLERIMRYFTSEDGIPGCRAGNSFVQLTPDGQVRQCADFSPFVHYTEYRGMEPTQCTRCWYSCRGESEASLSLERVLELWQHT